MQSLESGVRPSINLIYGELNGIATPGTEPPPPAEVQTNREEVRKAMAMQHFLVSSLALRAGKERLLLLLVGWFWNFATRMRQDRRKKMRLSY